LRLLKNLIRFGQDYYIALGIYSIILVLFGKVRQCEFNFKGPFHA